MNLTSLILIFLCIIGLYFYVKYKYSLYKKNVNDAMYIEHTQILGEKILKNYITSSDNDAVSDVVLLKKPKTKRRDNIKPKVSTNDTISRRKTLAIIAGKYMITDKKIIDYMQDRLEDIDMDKMSMDEKLLFCCKHLFEVVDDPMTKMLIGQYITIKTHDNKDIYKVFDYILQLANDYGISTNIRMNAVDILLQSNNTRYIKQANRVLESIRQIGDNRRINQMLPPNEDIALQYGLLNDMLTLDAQTQLEQTNRLVNATKDVPRTVFEDSQNVHNTGINESVLILARELVKEYNPAPNILTFNYNLIADMNPEERAVIEKSLHRIMTDSSTFKYDTNLYVIFQSLLKYIDTLNEPLKTNVNKRLIEELKEMSGLCVTGHLSRLLNVVQGFEEVPNAFKLKMSLDDEIYSTLKNRFDKLVMESEELADDMLSDEKILISERLVKETNSYLPTLYSSYSIDRKNDVLQGSLKAINKYLGKEFKIKNEMITTS